MADNTQLSAAVGTGDTIRDLDDGTVKWPVAVASYATTVSAGANVLAVVTPTAGLPVQPQTGATWAATQSGTWTVTGTGGTFPVTDSGGSLTVDAPVGTPVFVRLSDGAAAITTLPVSLASVPSHDVTNAGTFAVQAAQSGTWNIGTVTTLTGITNVVHVDDNGGSLTVDGTVTAALSASTNAGATAKTTDYDTGAGTDTVTMFGLALPASGGAVAGGTATNPVRTDPTGTTTQPVSGTVAVSTVTTLTGITNVVHVDDNSGSLTIDDGGASITVDGTVAVSGTVTTTVSGTVTVSGAVTQSGTWTVQPGNTANTTPWLVTDTPATSGGLSFSHITAGASNNKTQVKGSAGQLYAIHAVNLTATAKYVKVFDKTSANVTAGTTAADYQFVIPANSTTGAGFTFNVDKGIAHANGITVMLTGGVSLTDNTSLAANDVVCTFFYK